MFSCRQEINLQAVCLNGTHPCLLAAFEPFQIVQVKVAVWIVYGQWVESTKPPELSVGENIAEIRRLYGLAGVVSQIRLLRSTDQNPSRYGRTLLTYVRESIDNLRSVE